VPSIRTDFSLTIKWENRPSGHAQDSEEAIAFAENQDVKCMIEKYKLDQVEEAVKKMEEGKIRFRGVITFD
jgi:D-arabinose 1-dehydrogenase-like Zn-dependent alcohol dehydrogenase